MGTCKDKSNTYLRDVGYNVVKLPRQAFTPLTLLGEDNGSVEIIGVLSQLLSNPPATSPSIATDKIASSVNGNATSGMKLSLGLSILNGLISGLGGGKLAASLDFTNARKLTFLFNNVTFDSVQPLDVSNYLEGGDVDADSPLLKQYLFGKGKLYVITECLKSDEINIKLEKSDGVKAQVDVPVIQQAIGGSIGVEISAQGENVVTFKGPTKVAFAFKCFEIGVNDGVITMVAVRPGGIVASVGDAAQVTPPLLTTGGLLDVN